MSNKITLQDNNILITQNNIDLQALIKKANSLPEAGGGGGGSVETCTATIETAGYMAVFGWGKCTDQYGSTGTMPGLGGFAHMFPVALTRVFSDLPIGSVFTIYAPDKIKGVTTTGNVEFEYANHTTATIAPEDALFLVCKFNGTGTITIT